MKYIRYFRIFIIIFVSLSLVFSLILYQSYKEAVLLVKSQFNDQQMLLAHEMALSIEENFQLLTEELNLLSNIPGIKRNDNQYIRDLFVNSYKHVKNFYVTNIVLVNSSGRVTASLHPANLLDNNFASWNFFKIAHNTHTDNPIYEHIESGEGNDSERIILIAKPLLSEKGAFNGVLFFSVQVSGLIKAYIPRISIDKTYWVIESDGNILFHPDHTPGTNIYHVTEHSPFRNFLIKLKEGNPLKGEYITRNEQKILAASYPVKIGDRIGTIVIATPEAEISKLVKTFSKKFAIVTLVFILFLITSSSTIIFLDYKWNTKLTATNNRLHEEIEKREQAEKKLREQNDFFKTVIESLPHPFYVINTRDYTIKIANSSALKSGLSELTTCYQALHNSDTPCAEHGLSCPLNQVMTTHKPVTVEHIHSDASGNPRFFEIHGYPIFNEAGEVVQMIVSSQDITQRKKAEEQLKSSLQEKEILLGEIHHRVKNNLQVIYSLLSIQSEYVQDIRYNNIFKDCQNQIMSMAMVHEILYQTKDLANIKLVNYIKTLVDGLYSTYGINKRQIAYHLDIEEILLGVDNAIIIGLLINELVSNALKHAFPDSREGNITIGLHELEDDTYELMVKDDGIGLPEGFDIDNLSTFGLQMIQVLAEGKLHGKVTVHSNGGTEFRIHFASAE